MSNRQYSLTQKFYSRTIQFDHKLIRPTRWKQTCRLSRVTTVIGHLSLIQRCVPAVQIIDSARNPLRGTSHTCNTQSSIQSGKWEGLTVYSNMGEGCTRNNIHVNVSVAGRPPQCISLSVSPSCSISLSLWMSVLLNIYLWFSILLNISLFLLVLSARYLYACVCPLGWSDIQSEY